MPHDVLRTGGDKTQHLTAAYIDAGSLSEVLFISVMAGLDPAIYGLKKTASEIIPVRIEFKNQPDFPGARPMLDIVLPLNGGLDAVVSLRMYRAVATAVGYQRLSAGSSLATSIRF